MNSDEYRERINDRKNEIKYIQDLLKKGGYCVLCGYNRDPRIIQLHHIGGRKNNGLMIPVCPNCHSILSQNQNAWDHRWMDAHNSDSIRLSFMLRGLSDISKLQSVLFKEYSDRYLMEEST